VIRIFSCRRARTIVGHLLSYGGGGGGGTRGGGGGGTDETYRIILLLYIRRAQNCGRKKT